MSDDQAGDTGKTAGTVAGLLSGAELGSTFIPVPFIGPVIGAVLLATTQQFLAVTISSEVNVLVLGVMLVLFVVAAPKGIIGLVSRFMGKGGHA